MTINKPFDAKNIHDPIEKLRVNKKCMCSVNKIIMTFIGLCDFLIRIGNNIRTRIDIFRSFNIE